MHCPACIASGHIVLMEGGSNMQNTKNKQAGKANKHCSEHAGK
jgi:hypothetical protein